MTAPRAFLVTLGLLALAATASAETSKLWGREGELWKPDGRLPDFSYAGYRRGEAPIPDRKPDVCVRDFGAVGDGKTDDTKAFQKAIAASAGKVILVPAGRYVITDFLRIRSSATVLKGEGREKSILFFPKPLNDVKENWGATTSGRRTSNYSWSGGFVALAGSIAQPLSRVTAPAARGSRVLTVTDPSRHRVGQDVRLRLDDEPENTLAHHLYSGDPGDIEKLNRQAYVEFDARVSRVDAAKRRIEIDRPLRTDVRLSWKPRLRWAKSTVEESGIEDLGFEFPVTPYEGHFTERGFNALAVSGTRNCWIRRIWIGNCDSGMFVSGTNTTIRDVLITSRREPERQRRASGHHGVTLGGRDNLLRDFEFRTRFMHDITVSRGSAGHVVMRGSGPDLCLDHHRRAPHANLFTEIDLGEGTRMFQSGGGRALGRHAGAWTTFWNVRAGRGQRWPNRWGPASMTFVGVQPGQESETDPDGRWFEAISPGWLRPANLYDAQLARRLGR
jgi:hypothetical protein